MFRGYHVKFLVVHRMASQMMILTLSRLHLHQISRSHVRMSESLITDDLNQLLAIMIAETLTSFLTKGKLIAGCADSSSMRGLNADKASILNHHIPKPSSTDGGQRSSRIVVKVRTAQL
jgi:hypothetical protein